jgi:hypothetical protein
MRRITYITLLAVATTLSVVALAQLQEPGIAELRSNPEYVELYSRKAMLEQRKDSISRIMEGYKGEYMVLLDSITRLEALGEVVERGHVDSLASTILGMEQAIFDIHNECGDIVARLNTIEQEWVLSQMNITPDSFYADVPAEEQMEDVAEEQVEEAVPTVRNLIENRCFVDALSADAYAELQAAHIADATMDDLAREFHALYAELSATATHYRATDSESEADSLFTQYNRLVKDAQLLDEEITHRWNHVLDTKYYSYNYLLEREHRYATAEEASMAFVEMRRRSSEEVGFYASDALMTYVVGRPTLRDYEHTIAQEMGLVEARDSIAALRDSMPAIDYRLEPISLERRLFIDYEPITIGSTNYYKESNPIPALKIYERGTIYRILLGEFRNKQPMTLFKGVRPLFIDRNDQGHYLYYAGGYATYSEADEAVIFLRDKGFKAPEICRWQDGKMHNLSAAATDDGQATIGVCYMIHIHSSVLSDELRAHISAEAPTKHISRRGDGFAIGIFDNRDDAEVLMTLLSDSDASLDIEIVEIETNE